MMGWGMLILVAAASGVLLALLRFPKGMWMIPATAVTLAAAGYAWQGSPGLEGKPASAKQEGHEVDPGLIAIREAMFGRFNLEDGYFKISDAMMRQGQPEMAARAMLGAVTKVPDDAALWTWLGVALSESEKGLVSPAAQHAFDKAIALAPTHPGPRYFLGLMLTRSGQYAETRKQWAKAVELAPEKMAGRAVLVDQLAKLDAFLAENGVGQGGAAPASAATPTPEATPAQPKS